MKHALILFGLAIVAIVAWAVAFSAVENVGWFTGLYWAVTTATTVGYGDVTPHAVSGHVMAIGCMLTAIPLAAGSFSMLTSWHIRKHTRRHLEEQDKRHELALAALRYLVRNAEDPNAK